jgi:hypothetical protein
MARTSDDRWRLFCREFVARGGNIAAPNGKGAASALAAGYAKSDAANAAVRLLKRDDVIQLIGVLSAPNNPNPPMLPPPPNPPLPDPNPQAPYTIPTDMEILRRLDILSLSSKADSNRLKALELLGRYRALFQDRVAIDMPRRVVIEDPSGVPITTLGARG